MVKVIWNENAPLELLKSMPSVLNRKNLEEIQKVIDVDKFINSSVLQSDLCGIYAPFCEDCVKTLYCPCAQAYVRMKQKEGMQLEIAASDEATEESAPEVVEEAVEEVVEATEESAPAEEEVAPQEEESAPVEEKRYIRIAVAHKKR